MTPATRENIRLLLDNSNPRALQGWCWLEKAHAMCELIERERPGLVVDNGTFGGRSAIPQALVAKEIGCGIVVTIDPWLKAAALEGEHDQADSKWWATVDLNRVMQRFLAMVGDLGLVDTCVPIRASSQVAVQIFTEGSVDVLHIDGNHSEVASTRDVELWLPKVRAGGWIWLDDTDWPTNQKAVRMLGDACQFVREIKTEGLGECRLYRKITAPIYQPGTST